MFTEIAALGGFAWDLFAYVLFSALPALIIEFWNFGILTPHGWTLPLGALAVSAAVLFFAGGAFVWFAKNTYFQDRG